MDTTYDSLRAALLDGDQPNTIPGYVFQAVAAAGVNAPFGPTTGVYREDLARAIGDWAVDGINAIVDALYAEATEEK